MQETYGQVRFQFFSPLPSVPKITSSSYHIISRTFMRVWQCSIILSSNGLSFPLLLEPLSEINRHHP